MNTWQREGVRDYYDDYLNNYIFDAKSMKTIMPPREYKSVFLFNKSSLDDD